MGWGCKSKHEAVPISDCVWRKKGIERIGKQDILVLDTCRILKMGRFTNDTADIIVLFVFYLLWPKCTKDKQEHGR